MITAADIANQQFEHEKRGGYKISQVDEFLAVLESEVGAFNQQVDDLQAQNAQLRAQIDVLKGQLESAEAAAKAAPAATAAPAQTTDSAAEDAAIISQAIISAQRSAEAIKKEAREAGDKVYREAEAKSRDILRDALAEKQRTLEEVDRLKSSREQFRSDYLELLQKFVKQAEETFPDAFADDDAHAAAKPDPAATVSAAPVVGTAYGAAAGIDVDDDLD